MASNKKQPQPSYADILPPDPRANLIVKIDRRLMAQVKMVAGSQNKTIQIAVDEALSEWVIRNRDEAQALLK